MDVYHFLPAYSFTDVSVKSHDTAHISLFTKITEKIEYKATTEHLNLSLKISLRNVPNCFIATFS